MAAGGASALFQPLPTWVSLTAIFEVLCWLLISDMDVASTSVLYPVSIWLAQCYCATMLYFQYTLFSKKCHKRKS